MDNPVHHRVCNRWRFQVLVPLVDGRLRGNGDGQAACPVIDQIKQILPVEGGQGRQSPVIKDQKPGFVHRCAQFRQAAVTPCDLDFLQKPGKSPVNLAARPDCCRSEHQRGALGFENQATIAHVREQWPCQMPDRASWKALLATLALRSKMLWNSWSRRKFELHRTSN